MFDGYLALGQTEILNAARTLTYVRNLLPTIGLLKGWSGSEYDTLAEALGDPDYVNPVADDAPWLSPDDEATQRFYGLFPQREAGITDSTLSASVTERVDAGAVINTPRDASRNIAVRVVAVAADELALEAGKTWLRNMLARRGCALHDDSCPASDLKFFLAKPDPDAVTDSWRHYHSVECTVGMEVVQQLDTGDCGYAEVLEFTLTAENPFQYKAPVDPATGSPVLVGYHADVLVNRIKNPSAEFATVTPGQLVPNPNVAENLTGYTLVPGAGGVASLARVATPNEYGEYVARATWSTATVVSGLGGISYTMPATPGVVYAPMVNHIKTSIAQPMSIQVEYLNAAGAVITAGSNVWTSQAGAIHSQWREAVVAPALTASLRIRIYASGGGQWTAGSYLEVTGLRVNVAVAGVVPDPYYISNIIATNYVANPSAETGVNYWNSIPGTSGTAAVARVAAVTPYGVYVARTTWTVASTAAGGGAEVALHTPTPAGVICSAEVNLIRSSINNRLKVRITFSSPGVTFVDSAEFQVTAGVATSVKIENFTVPPGTTVITIRVISVAGTGYANWSIGSYLEVDGVMFNNGSTAWPYYFDTFTPVPAGGYAIAQRFTGISYGSTYLLAPKVTGWLESTSAPNAAVIGGAGSTVVIGRTNAQAHDRTHSSRTLWIIGATSDGDGIVTGPYSATPVAGSGTINAGSPYEFAIWVRPSKSQRLAAHMNFLADDGTIISTVAGVPVAVVGGVWTRLTVGGVAPTDTAAAAGWVQSGTGTGYSRWAVGDYIDADAATLTFGTGVPPYFDGDTAADADWVYSWDGSPDESISIRTAAADEVTVIVDPDLPVLATPPVPPPIPNDAITDISEWLRYSIDIESEYVPLWAGAVPIVTLTTDTEDVRQVRVRFYPNPDELPVEDLDPDSFQYEFVLSYLPADAVLVVDGIEQEAYASVGSLPPAPADNLLYGTGGAPMVWGELTGGIDWVLTVDIPPTSDIDNLDVGLELARRE